MEGWGLYLNSPLILFFPLYGLRVFGGDSLGWVRLTKHKFDSEGFKIYPKDNTLYPQILDSDEEKVL